MTVARRNCWSAAQNAYGKCKRAAEATVPINDKMIVLGLQAHNYWGGFDQLLQRRPRRPGLRLQAGAALMSGASSVELAPRELRLACLCT